MSDVDCRTLQDVACSDHCAMTFTLYFDQLQMTHSIERQKAKHINWKFEDAGFKRRLYQRLDSMLDAAPAGLLRVIRGADANGLNDLLTFMSNVILKSKEIAEIAARKYLGCGNLQNSMCQGGMSEQGVECSIQGGSEPLKYFWAPKK